jgi:hypothetical protein
VLQIYFHLHARVSYLDQLERYTVNSKMIRSAMAIAGMWQGNISQRMKESFVPSEVIPSYLILALEISIRAVFCCLGAENREFDVICMNISG